MSYSTNRIIYESNVAKQAFKTAQRAGGQSAFWKYREIGGYLKVTIADVEEAIEWRERELVAARKRILARYPWWMRPFVRLPR